MLPSENDKCLLYFVASSLKRKKSITLKNSFPNQHLEYVSRDNQLKIGKGNN